MNLTALPNNGHAPTNESIADHLREQADWVVDGEYGEVKNVFLIIETRDGGLHRRSCGSPCDVAREVGIYQFAATRAIVGDEE